MDWNRLKAGWQRQLQNSKQSLGQRKAVFSNSKMRQENHVFTGLGQTKIWADDQTTQVGCNRV